MGVIEKFLDPSTLAGALTIGIISGLISGLILGFLSGKAYGCKKVSKSFQVGKSNVNVQNLK